MPHLRSPAALLLLASVLAAPAAAAHSRRLLNGFGVRDAVHQHVADRVAAAAALHGKFAAAHPLLAGKLGKVDAGGPAPAVSGAVAAPTAPPVPAPVAAPAAANASANATATAAAGTTTAAVPAGTATTTTGTTTGESLCAKMTHTVPLSGEAHKVQRCSQIAGPLAWPTNYQHPVTAQGHIQPLLAASSEVLVHGAASLERRYSSVGMRMVAGGSSPHVQPSATMSMCAQGYLLPASCCTGAHL
jgi:hypothetical protein